MRARKYVTVDVRDPSPYSERERLVRVTPSHVTVRVCGADIELPRSSQWVISGPAFVRLSPRSKLSNRRA